VIAYLVAGFAMALSATCALTLITVVNHFDAPETSPASDRKSGHHRHAA